MLSKNVIFATLVTALIIFVYIKTVEAEPTSVIHDTTSTEIILSSELLDKDLAIMVLGGIDYYVENCTELTSQGVSYRNKVISYHDILEAVLPINPTYIKGALSVSGYNCYEMYELITTLDESNSNLVVEPGTPTKYNDID
tara:strand:- start:146 stop:568 length:423 start_codon:yes stop_codon:yes gene_type:complete